MFESNFKLFAVGIVAEDKSTDSKVVRLAVTEHFYQEEMRLDDVEVITASMKSNSDNYEDSNVNKQMYVKASWLSYGSGARDTPPDLVRGETCLIYKFGDVDQYYWEKVFRENDLRRKEHVVYRWNNASEFGEKTTDENSVTLTVSTADGYIYLRTPDNDGEKARYDFKINMKDGNIELKDNAGNSFLFDSVDSFFKMVLEKLVHIETVDTVLKSENSVSVETKTSTLDATERTVINTPKFSVNGNGNELISAIKEALEAARDEKHIGNLGILTEMDPSSKAAIQVAIDKIDTFIG